MLKPKLQYSGHWMRRSHSLEKTLMLGKIEGRRRRGWQRMRWLNSVTDSMDMNLGKLREILEDRGVWRPAVHRLTKSRTRLSNWTTVFPEPGTEPKAECINTKTDGMHMQLYNTPPHPPNPPLVCKLLPPHLPHPLHVERLRPRAQPLSSWPLSLAPPPRSPVPASEPSHATEMGGLFKARWEPSSQAV